VTGSVWASERSHCTPGPRKANDVKARMHYALAKSSLKFLARPNSAVARRIQIHITRGEKRE
jgi:hypothetical protein